MEWGFNSKKTVPLAFTIYDYFRLKESSKFLKIPLRIKYYLNSKKNTFYISCAYSPTIHLSTFEKVTYYYTGRKEKMK